MRIRIDDKTIMEAGSVEIVTGENCIYIESDENHPERNFDIQCITSGCADCEAFSDEECRCE